MTSPSPEPADLLAAIGAVVRTFERDEAQGYRSRDRQYAIEMLKRFVQPHNEPVAEPADLLIDGMTARGLHLICEAVISHDQVTFVRLIQEAQGRQSLTSSHGKSIRAALDTLIERVIAGEQFQAINEQAQRAFNISLTRAEAAEAKFAALLRLSASPQEPEATVRCICEGFGDNPACPVDHDQVQHEAGQASPAPQKGQDQ